jgi:hypothetical protein
MEAASHGNPRSFQVAVTVVLEQLKREELKGKTRSQRNEAYSLLPPSLLLPTLL